MESHHQNLLVHQPLEYRIAPNAREQKIRLNTSDNGENCDPPLSLSSSFFQRRGCFARFLRVALFRGQISSNVSHERDRRTVSFNTPDNDRRSLRVNRSTDTYWIGIGVRARLGDDARVTRDNDRRADDSVHGVLPRESAADDRSRTISTISHARSNSFAPIRTSRGPFRDHP